MNIKRFFRGGTVEQATESNAVLDEITAEERRQREAQAEAITRERRSTEEYRARVTADANERRGRLNESLDELGDLVPRLLLACSHFNTIATEVQEKGLGFLPGGQLLEDIFCIPPDFGARLVAAIKEISPRTEWDYGHIGVLGKGKKAERPKIKEPPTLRMPRFPGDNGPPPGFNGIWNMVKGRPMDPSEEVPFVILPTG